MQIAERGKEHCKIKTIGKGGNKAFSFHPYKS